MSPFSARRRSAPNNGLSASVARQEIMSSGVWLAASSLAPLVATAALSVVIGRVLGADLLGQQSLIAYGASLSGAVLVGSLTSATIQSLAARRDDKESASTTGWVVVTHAVLGLAAGLLLIAYGLLRGQFVAAWLVVALSGVLDAVGWGYAAKLIATDGWRPVARRRLVAQLAAIVLGLGAVLLGMGITGVFAANSLASAGLLLSVRAATTAPAAPMTVLPKAVARLWGVFAAGAVLTQIVAKRIEFVFLAAYSTASEIAAYSITATLVSVAIIVPSAMAGAAMPSVAAAIGLGDHRRAQASLGSAIRVTAVASLPLAAVLVAAGPAAVTGLYGSNFLRAAGLVPLAALGAVVAPVSQLCTTYWAAVGKLRVPLSAGVAGGCVDLVVAFWLIPEHGAMGAVIASLSGQVVTAIGTVALTWRAVGRFRLGLPGWLATIGAATVAAVAGRLCSDLVGKLLLGSIVGSIVCLVVFVLMSALLRRLRAPTLGVQDGAWLMGTLPQFVAPIIAGSLVDAQPDRNAAR